MDLPDITTYLSRFELKKPRKNEERLQLVQRLSDLLNRTTKSVHFTTLIWTNDMLKDSIQACQHFQDIKARNYHFNAYKASTKLSTV